MDLRFSTSTAFSLVLFLSPLSSQTVAAPRGSETNWYATIQVQIRDSNGHPVSGLEPANFLVNENGSADPVVSVQSFQELTSAPPVLQTEIPNQRQPSSRSVAAQTASSITNSARPTTWVLIILTPMSATGRNASITGIQKFLNQPHPADWSFALFDDAGESTPFSQDTDEVRSRLITLEHHSSARQFIGGPWVPLATRAIAELGTRPGRRVVIFASDFKFDIADPTARDRHLLRVSPSVFVDAAVRAQAPMYTLQASGPGVVVPFGGAADIGYNDGLSPQSPLSGEFIAERLNSAFISEAGEFNDFLWSAYQTGGRPARNMKDAFERIAEDAAGLYRITFRPQLLEADGSWHPINVVVSSPRVHARYSTYYVAPTAENRLQIPSAMLTALKGGAKPSGLDAAAHVWIFPALDGISTAVMTADISWPEKAQSTPQSKVQIYVQIINENIGQAVGSWISDRDWVATEDAKPSIHWQREIPLYPGAYNLRVFAYDPASRRIATRAFSFVADPFGGPHAIRLSPTLIASRCLKAEEIEGRKSLFDPLMFEGCLLAPTASATFSVHDTPTVLVRFYPSDRKLDATILERWKAYASVGESPLIPLKITAGDVRGFMASGQLNLENLNLKPGRYQVTVGFDIGRKEPIFARASEVIVTP